MHYAHLFFFQAMVALTPDNKDKDAEKNDGEKKGELIHITRCLFLGL